MWSKDRPLSYKILDNRYPNQNFSERTSKYSEGVGTYAEFLEDFTEYR